MKRRKRSADADRGKYRDQTTAWRQHLDDPWAELERMGLTEAITALGWSQPRVTRALNSVASEAAFRVKVQRAMSMDEPLHLAGGVGRPGSPEGDHGYTRSASESLDPDAEVIDLPTLGRIQRESEAKREQSITELVLAAEAVRAELDKRVKENPAFMSLAGKHIWVIRSKIDALTRDLKRKAA